MEISQQAFLQAWENQKLVRGALKYAHVRQDYTNYEDFLQEGIITYAHMLTQNQTLSREEVDRSSFRKIIWRTTDLLRKEQHLCERESELTDLQIVEDNHNWDNYLALEAELPYLSDIEQKLFIRHLIGREPVQQLSRQIGVSRVQLQRIKSQLLNRLQEVLER
ncbi:sigma-70 family RNA polymerase sigma factor [Lactobacillus sp. ESL0263]|uniref:sigma-70 family RNA polymerase sigma factor n=1 Tax=Lactobacillus sp. ESL0263 TaxID=2069350 RepID=UPI000EFC5932|nr:sigma-70 family RNA polymerase sigma factor [Lactobacillus sp. ESL0263]RMC48500.1 sigma-70 family RNA polymerase sigma factor [Lactobacillus sp. ESL0263]